MPERRDLLLSAATDEVLGGSQAGSGLGRDGMRGKALPASVQGIGERFMRRGIGPAD